MACPYRNAQVNNFLNDKTYVDTLHQRTFSPVPCNTQRCMGSLMSQQAHRPPGVPRSQEELLVHATDFIDQYFNSCEMSNTPAHLNRISEIQDSVTKSGTYDLTMAELTFGAKQAWRNAPRCIGRMQWSKLQVFDARCIMTPRGMYTALCDHIRYATNKGNIRSAITIFPQRIEGRPDFRVWNSQLIGYAGYSMDDGKIIGDPANVEFTDQCVKMGWKPKYGMFDLLPLVLSAAGFDPELFDLPSELVLEVKLVHPKYPWFSDLGLKWYALPAVSGMLLDCGGLEFPSCPFNGWYMGTEIGSRDLCDSHRYNMLETIALKMGLNTRNASSLWKDRALLEANRAVLHSFQSANVTIVNHHDASESFMLHLDNEQHLRGGCPGDWVWVVPPISSSALEIFHQELLLYKLKPSFEYQDIKPLSKYVCKKVQNMPNCSVTAKSKLGFKQLARAVKVSALLMSKALASRVQCTILYASETGRSERFAKRLSDIFKQSFASKVVCMENYPVGSLVHESLVLVITSTFGNGEPPENGKMFCNSLFAWKKKKDNMNGETEGCSIATYIKMSILPDTKVTQNANLNNSKNSLAMVTGPLANVRYAVFALGSKAFPHFAAFGSSLHLLFGELGAEAILDLSTGDEMCGQEQSFRTWSEGVFKAAHDAFCLKDANTNEATGLQKMGDHSWSLDKVRIVPVENGKEPDLCHVLSEIHGKKVRPFILTERTQLQAQDSNRQTILVHLKKKNASDLDYAPGDHVCIFPANPPDIVNAILVRLDTTKGPSPDEVISTEISTQLGTNETWRRHEKLPICSLRTAFTYLLDVTIAPSQELLHMFATQASSDMDKKRLRLLAMDSVAYEKWQKDLSPNILEVLDQFPSLKVSPSLLLTQLPLLHSRCYSISSSPQKHPTEVHATIAVVKFRTQGGAGPLHEGICSSWLNRCPLQTIVPCFISKATHFHMPEEPTLPIIMIGPGTGIAPFRSFWQQRMKDIEMNNMASRKIFGEMELYFGCRSAKENIYANELEEMKKSGVLSNYHVALSREPDLPKVHVQDIMLRNAASICEMIFQKEGHIYISGDVSMACGVTRTLKLILCEQGGIDRDQAENYVTSLRDENRFHEEIFGAFIREPRETRSEDQPKINLDATSMAAKPNSLLE